MLQNATRVARLPLKTDRDVAIVRSRIAQTMTEMGANDLMKTRFVTAVSEIARNTVSHGTGGTIEVFKFADGRKVGIECHDKGSGIADIDAAMVDGFTTRKGSLGRGLGGAKRLAHEFSITSADGAGTTVCMTGLCRLR